MFISNNIKTIAGQQVKVIDRTETSRKVWAKRLAIGAVALIAISMVVLGSLALYSNLTHTTIGFLHPNTLGQPTAISLLTSGSVLLLITIAISCMRKYRASREIDRVIKHDKEQLELLLRGMKNEKSYDGRLSCNNIVSLTEKLGDQTFYLILVKGKKEAPTHIHILKSLTYRNQLLEKLDT